MSKVRKYSTLYNDFIMSTAIEIPHDAKLLWLFYICNTVGYTRNGMRTTNHQMSKMYPTKPLNWTESKVRYWRDWLVKYGFITKTEVIWKDEQHKNEHRTINDISVVINPSAWHPPKYVLKEKKVAPPPVLTEQGLHQITGSEVVNEYSMV